jgi:peptidoglycan hydrolase-like protein with peptidoglycan-binding domain
MFRAALLAVLVLFLAPVAARAADVRVYFTKGEQLAYITRDLEATPTAALASLLAGPTPAEQKKGYGTTIPLSVVLTSAKVDGERADIELSGPFEVAEPMLHARLAQIVYTVTAVDSDITEVKILGKTYTRADFGPEPFTQPKPPTKKTAAPADPKAVQTKLAGLGYLPTDAVTGTWDYRTMQAVIAFQAWSGLSRDGVVGPQTLSKLSAAGRPLPLDRTSKGKRVEIYRARGVVLLINNGKVVRAIHTSTGIGGDSPDIGTPPGKWKIYRKEVKSWSVPYKTWLPYAAYWVGGWALHGYADVPVQPASLGCARQPLPEAKIVYDFVSIGTPVQVI